MRNFKKVIAAGLALLMLALSVNVSFAAEEYTDKEAIVVAKVNAAGIMQGTDKGFEPSKTLTRAEAAAIMVRMKGISEDTVKQNSGATLFTDVAASHWAAGYVNVASNYGIIKGVGANKFAPEKEVTVAEFYTMAIRALNAGQLVEAEGTWPTNYVNFAIENDLAEDVAQIYTANATRMTAATIVANTLVAEMWKKDSVKTNGEVTWSEAETNILYNTLHIVEYKKVVFSNIDTKELEANATNMAWNNVAITKPEFNEKAGLGSAKEGIEYTVWYDTKEEEIVGFWVPTSTDSITFTDVKTETPDGSKVKLVIDGKEKEYKLAAAPEGTDTRVFKINGTDATKWTDLKKGTMPLFGIAYLDASGKIDKVYAESYQKWGVVKDVTSSRITFDKDIEAATAQTITINKDEDKDYEYFVTKDGKAIDIEDIDAGDVVFYYQKTGTLTFVVDVYSNTVEGRVSATNGQKVTIDGTKYDSIITGDKAIKAGKEGTFYLNNAGKIVMYELDEEAKGDYAVISQLRVRKPSYSDDKNLVEAKLATMDGNVTDWMSINLEKSHADFKTLTQANGLEDADKDKDNKYLAADKVKVTAVVQYEIKDNKIVLKETKSTEFKGFFDAKLDYVQNKADSANVYLKSNAKAYEVFAYETGKYELKELTIDELSKEPEATGFYGDYDSDDNEAGLLFFLTGATYAAEPDWAFILDASYDYDDNNDDTKEDSIYDVVFSNGETKSLYAEASKVKLIKGQAYELSLNGDVITRAYSDNHDAIEGEKVSGAKDKLIQKAVTTALTGKYVHEVKANGLVTFVSTKTVSTKKYVDLDTITAGYDLADDVLVISKEAGKENYKLSSFDAIGKLEETDDNVELDLTNYNSIVRAVQFTDSDNDTSLVVLIYEK